VEARRGIDEIAEEDRDDTPLLPIFASIVFEPELGAARRAVPRRVEVGSPADRAGGHGWSVWRPTWQDFPAIDAAAIEFDRCAPGA
jgi:hypothetical protein